MTSKISRFSTGMTAFVASGLLVVSILQGHGGSTSSQQQWKDANERAVSILREDSYLDRIIPRNEAQYIDQNIDPTTTAAISSEVSSEAVETPDPIDEEPSVLALIRKNSDVKPGVSSGTARVSVVIKSGDTLFNISQRHGISIDDLADLNGLSEPYTIKIGQTLYLAR
jgi:LysM repeat protein